jgi:uncharacterized protein involved in exopolysaccharide biosynthesis
LYPLLGPYKGLFEVTPQAQSTVIILEAEGSSPDLARQRVATLINVYQQRLNELRLNETDAQEQFARKELEKSRSDLSQAQNALAKFQQSTGLVNKDEQTKGLISAIDNLKNTKATLTAEAQANLVQANEAAARLRTTPQKAMNSLSLSGNKEYQAIRDEVTRVETALAQARGKFTDTSPQVQALLLERQELRRELNQRFAVAVPGTKAQEVDTTLGGGNESRDSRIDMITELTNRQIAAKGLQKQAGQIQNQLDSLRAELNSISANQTRLSELQRNYEIAEGVHKGVLAQLQQAETNPFNAYPNVQVLDEPTIDPNPLGPKRWLIVLGGVLASILGSTALVLSREARNPLLSPKDLQQVELPILVSVPRLKRPDMEQHLGADLAIEFQQLASAISSMRLDNQRLMVTSSTFGEGKTTVTLGLALALVNFGFRVLVVDGDLRQASMSRRFGHSQKAIEAMHAKQTLVSVYPDLDLMPAPLIPKDKIAEFFARGSFERRLSTIQNSGDYDYVLVDSPPVSLTIEPSLMSSVVRNVLFVVRPGTSDRYSVMDGFEQFTRHNARITGLVVNGVESRTAGYRYYGRQRELLEAEA